jgi:hypothetical protein
MRQLLLRVAALLLITPLAHAGFETGTVRFEYMQIFSTPSHPGFTFFYLEGGTKTDKPACATYNNGERWVINNAWPAAKLQVAVLLSAFLVGRKVWIQGTNDCGAWGDTETVWDVHPVD